MKKTLIILTGIIVLIAIFGGIYLYIHRTQSGSASSSFFGFGGTSSTQGASATNNSPSPSGDSSAPQPPSAVRLIHQNPVSGFGITTDSTGSPVVDYQERALGHIFETKLPDGTETELSKTTQPTVYESYWGTGNTRVLMRSMDQRGTLNTNILTVASGQTSALAGSITSVSVSPDGSHFFSITSTPQGAVGQSITADGSIKKQLFSSPLSEWIATWTNPSLITIATKPSALAVSSLYALDARTGSLKPLLTNLPGLTGSLSPDGKTLLYSIGAGGGIQTGYQDIQKGISTRAPFTTLPEKCVWSTHETGAVFCAIPNTIPQGNYPDDWYRGAVRFSDSIWKFNVQNGMGVGRLLVRDIPNEPIDATSLALDPKDTYLLFINKNDGSLWSITIENTAISSVEGGE